MNNQELIKQLQGAHEMVIRRVSGVRTFVDASLSNKYESLMDEAKSRGIPDEAWDQFTRRYENI